MRLRNRILLVVFLIVIATLMTAAPGPLAPQSVRAVGGTGTPPPTGDSGTPPPAGGGTGGGRISCGWAWDWPPVRCYDVN
jgi:hypothetical protein